MVRVGAVKHLSDRADAGYAEMFRGRQRYKIVDQDCLMRLLDIDTAEQLVKYRQTWIDDALAIESPVTREQDPRWSDGLAVGDFDFVNEVKAKLGLTREGRQILQDEQGCILRETDGEYKRRQFLPEN